MGKLYRRGKVWWADFQDSTGRRYRLSLRTSDRAVARERLRRLELDPPHQGADAQASLGPALRYFVDVACVSKAAGTVESYEQKVRHLARVIGADHVLPLTRPEVQRYIATRLKEDGASPGSVHKELVVLRGALREAGFDAAVVPKFSAQYQPRERHLSPEQFRDVLDRLAPKRRLWLMVATYLGGRDSEINGHRVGDVDLEHLILRNRGTKTKDSRRSVPIPAALVPWLEARCRDAGPDEPLVEEWTNRRRDICIAYWKATGVPVPKKHQSTAGLPRLSPNDLRRTFASWMKQAGVDSLAVAHLLGHSSTRMVEMVYGRLTTATYRAAVSVLPECDADVTTQVHKPAISGIGGTDRMQVSPPNAVPRGRIERPTRGFSVLKSDDTEDSDPPVLTALPGGKK
jgi:integrase